MGAMSSSLTVPARPDDPMTADQPASRVLVLGGDGYLGWPTALHLSARGHDIAVADNFVRRDYDRELGVQSLVPIESLETRVRAWHEVSGEKIDTFVGDLCEAEFTYSMLREFQPEA